MCTPCPGHTSGQWGQDHDVERQEKDNAQRPLWSPCLGWAWQARGTVLEGWICTTTLPREALYPHLAEGHDLPKTTALQRARAVFEALSVCPQSPDRLFLQHTRALRACLVAQTLSHSGFLGGLETKKMISHT